MRPPRVSGRGRHVDPGAAGLPCALPAPRGAECSARLVVKKGPDFTSLALAQHHGVELAFIRPGKPIENAFIESFNGRFRDECLNLHWFTSLAEARQRIERWRDHYNHVRPHSSLGDRPLVEFSLVAGLDPGLDVLDRHGPGGRSPRPSARAAMRS